VWLRATHLLTSHKWVTHPWYTSRVRKLQPPPQVRTPTSRSPRGQSPLSQTKVRRAALLETTNRPHAVWAIRVFGGLGTRSEHDQRLGVGEAVDPAEDVRSDFTKLLLDLYKLGMTGASTKGISVAP